MSLNIRPATIEDVPSILEIVNYNIVNTTSIYDYSPKAIEDMEVWFSEKQSAGWPVLVSEENGVVTGYATYGTFRVKEGYKFTVEHSVYVHHGHHGKGTGAALLEHLIDYAKTNGCHVMVGCIDAENKGSIAFHKRFGFTESGLLKEAAFKFDKWLDLQFMQLIL